MEFGMKRVMASVQVVATMNRMYTGTPVPLTELSKETKLSVSYLEQIFKKLRAGKIVVSQRGPGGGYSLCDKEISVSEVIRAVSKIPTNSTFEPVLNALSGVLVSQLHSGKSPSP
ncbi:RrF2 family transcriptional regulator [Dryocola boscaweniae]|nr:Rrf2 family transcriptional regulator [Dryocola boscaweniae]